MIDFDDRVAIVTGSGAGLGRSHALGLAARGARVVVNDLGNAQDVASEIDAAGGDAMAHDADVSDEAQVADMIAKAMDRWGRIDILVNNAGILRDKTFAKMTLEDFRKVVDVHLMGSANCCHAVWPVMRAQKYGRIVLTSSGSGLYGNFGQSNYGAAKAAMIGLMNVLHLEGARDDIRVNTLAPTAATQMTKGLLPEAALDLLQPETITPGLLHLVSENGPSRTILSAGAGTFAQTRIYETQGHRIQGEITPEAVAANWHLITEPNQQEELQDAFSQTRKYALRAAKAKGATLDW
ncbi:MAG: SDR family NAD(P)-dependent oxidoreductase [Tateyamaria sp.]|jgi:NAD(P)-dependent dehydrogenase (short-subunit alcohol dehydrogenase family)|nr:SDR family NAD(P)-dependent oxidoreductase [Tateyamaria sp.]MDG1182739.1 SDR family NAD(P)-dependent oxidoreductase [Tateyamaria sp.]MDG1334555.1 SDR family NAD(P)-dependent oxidoreductase [Tateyamaria sp.]MDG2058111.1 SDR family NAD(P)-dependent oxidoreductase [Tateyamaria sp.]